MKISYLLIYITHTVRIFSVIVINGIANFCCKSADDSLNKLAIPKYLSITSWAENLVIWLVWFVARESNWEILKIEFNVNLSNKSIVLFIPNSV